MNRWSPMGKLGAMAGDTTTTVIDMTPGAVPGSMVNGPEDLIDWDAIDWRAQEKRGRRGPARIFKAAPTRGAGKNAHTPKAIPSRPAPPHRRRPPRKAGRSPPPPPRGC